MILKFILKVFKVIRVPVWSGEGELGYAHMPCGYTKRDL